MTEWLAVISITILAIISPGPDFAMVSRNALSLSRRAGMMTALGIVGAWGWIGVVPLLTGRFGWCPLYPLLGINTCQMKKSN